MQPNVWIFGPFELDSGRFELRRDGEPVRIERIPLELLLLLVTQKGQLVSRQEIVDAVWGPGAHLEAEQAINTAIRKLRYILRDNPESPQFVQTVVGKGYRFVGDVTRNGDALPEPLATEPVPVLQPGRREPIPLKIILLAALPILIAAAWWYARNDAQPASPLASEPLTFQITRSPLLVDNRYEPAISPDGRKVAYRGVDSANRATLWVYYMNSGESRVLAEADGSMATPFWSPDSRFLGFPTKDKLKMIEVASGVVRTVCDLPNPVWTTAVWGGGAWNQDGTILFGAGPNTLYWVPATGGGAVPLTTLDSARHELSQSAPAFLPDGRHFLYNRRFSNHEDDGVYVAPMSEKPEAQGSKRVLASGFNAVYTLSPDLKTGHLLFTRDDALMVQPFDQRRLELTGKSQRIAELVGTSNPGFGRGWFSASANGVLVYRRPNELPKEQLTWLDRHGNVTGTAGGLGVHSSVALSPDGTRVAVDPTEGGGPRNRDVWVYDLSRGTGTRVSSNPGADQLPVWSPDSRQVVFISGPQGGDVGDLHRKAASGAGEEEVLLKPNVGAWPKSWSPDGRFLLYSTRTSVSAPMDFWLLPMDPSGGPAGQPMPFFETTFNERHGRFSPDGHFVVYTSDESGTDEVYVAPFSEASAGKALAARWTISKGGGVQPAWRGGEIFYLSRDSKMMAVDVSTTASPVPSLRAGVPKALFEARIQGAGNPILHAYDVTADGQRFLVRPRPIPVAQPAPPITVLMNWSRLAGK